MKRELALLISLLLVGPASRGAETGGQPFIDSVKKQLAEEDAEEGKKPEGSFTETEKKKLESEAPATNESYIEQLKKADPEKYAKPAEPSLIEKVRPGLEPKESGGAILALQEGKSELKPRFEGDIHNAVGLRYGANLSRTITASAGASGRNFNDVYGGNYVPDLTFFYEWQPFHSEIFGNIGFVGSVGASYFHGYGTFSVALPESWLGAGNYFPSQSRTPFQFFVLPVMVGASYRFNLTHYLRPFVTAGPTAIGYIEQRGDGVGTNFQGYSKGLSVSGGVSLLMDWLGSGTAWDAYAVYGIRHTYLTVEYQRLTTISGDVDFSVSGVFAGVTFEF